VLPLPWRLRLLGLPLMLPLLGRRCRGRPRAFELVAADIGQGTAVLVRTARHLLVYDTGPAVFPESDAGQRVLLPLLRGAASAGGPADAEPPRHRPRGRCGRAAGGFAGASR
jgi:competence protein ComEC